MGSQELFSVTELQRMCEMSEYLDGKDIHMNDKTVSWDGNIIYFTQTSHIKNGFCTLINQYFNSRKPCLQNNHL